MDSKQLQELRLRHHACSNANEVIALALEAEELRGLAKAAQMNYIEESLEAERLRTNFRRITGWDDEQLEQGMIHLEEAAMVKARRLAGTEAKS
jgi:hypothetical protein